ncbi:hypothetical protein [Chryseobacterium turcicum]|uniref:Uncharacterized protein n=1 Tax=Chryseobacterium turcicum TaxID=2898076 RepID=A0A9Q3YUC0_9FLAO|nr:hypothetical protein [Chryseobacterium turcicum]MCD1116201.1 hypothetical protein [Chryseobacterium turcicum]
MKIYRFYVSSENGFQAVTDLPPRELLERNLYTEYPFNNIDSIRLDMDEGTEMADVLKVGTTMLHGFPIRNKFYDILKNFNLFKIQFVDIIDRDLKDYKFMFFNSDLTYDFDYQKSDFILIEDILGNITELDEKIDPSRDTVVRAYDDFCIEDIFNRVVPRNGYHFLPDFNIWEHDVFRIGHFDMSFYVSEKVKNALESNNITGVEFIEESLFNVEQ